MSGSDGCDVLIQEMYIWSVMAVGSFVCMMCDFVLFASLVSELVYTELFLLYNVQKFVSTGLSMLDPRPRHNAIASTSNNQFDVRFLVFNIRRLSKS